MVTSSGFVHASIACVFGRVCAKWGSNARISEDVPRKSHSCLLQLNASVFAAGAMYSLSSLPRRL
eukprot:2695099-Prorocentrum_lima.AAC.1